MQRIIFEKSLGTQFLEVNEEIEFKPTVTINEGSYSIICQYKSIGSIKYAQTIIPFGLKEASQKGEVFVITKELEHKTNIDQ